mgnify:FL=1
MSKTYEDEQAQLKEEIQTLQQEIEIQERQIENLEQFIQRVHKYKDLCSAGTCQGSLYRSPGQVQRQAASGHPHFI